MAKYVHLPRWHSVAVHWQGLCLHGLWRNVMNAFASAQAFDTCLVEMQSMLTMSHYNIGEKEKACSLIDSQECLQKALWMDYAVRTAEMEKRCA